MFNVNIDILSLAQYERKLIDLGPFYEFRTTPIQARLKPLEIALLRGSC